MLATISITFAGLTILGLPIALAIGSSAIVYIVFIERLPMDVVIRTMFYSLDSFAFLAIPLFMLIGSICDRSGLLDKLVQWLLLVIGWAKAGMAYVTVLANLVMAGVSGAAVADMASLGPIQMKLMRDRGYPNDFSAVLNAASAVMGPIIPPSIAMVVYALAAGNISIGGLFLAGAIPGALLGLGLLILAWFKTRHFDLKPTVLPTAPREYAVGLIKSTIEVTPLLVLPVIIVGSIITGLATVTESAALGAAYILLVAVLQRRLSLYEFRRCVIYSGVMTASVGLLIATGALVGWILTRNRVTALLAETMIAMSSDPLVFLILVVALALLLGMFLDPNVIIITLTPLLAPIAATYGVDQFQFAIVFILTVEIGLITPPVGYLLFIGSSISNEPLQRIFVSIIPFVIVEMIVVALVVLFPPLATWLPAVLGFS